MLQGDPNEYSVYRQEVIEEMTKALDCQVFNEKVQVQSARALLILGSCFSYAGQPVVEQCLLKEAGYDENAGDSYLGKNFILNSYTDMVNSPSHCPFFVLNFNHNSNSPSGSTKFRMKRRRQQEIGKGKQQ